MNNGSSNPAMKISNELRHYPSATCHLSSKTNNSKHAIWHWPLFLWLLNGLPLIPMRRGGGGGWGRKEEERRGGGEGRRKEGEGERHQSNDKSSVLPCWEEETHVSRLAPPLPCSPPPPTIPCHQAVGTCIILVLVFSVGRAKFGH